ncbi:MAG: hypothetical protein AB7S26_28140 [Sandaracinaceae bacterium]
MYRPAVLVTLLFASSPLGHAHAQSVDSSSSFGPRFRFGIGLDQASLVGRGDGFGGGLRLTLGARLHEYVALVWQGQVLGAGFFGADNETAMFAGWSSVLAEADLGIFQLGAGPSFDVTLSCPLEVDVDTQTATFVGCADRVAPGLALRAGVRFGIFTLSADLHATFDDARSDAEASMGYAPSAWFLVGLGIQLGDTAREPMRFPSTDRPPRARDEDDLSIEPTHAVPSRPAASTSLGRALSPPPTEAPEERSAPAPRIAPPPERAPMPVTRRFDADDVSRGTHIRPVERTPEVASEGPALDGLDLEDTSDPIDGAEE